MFPFIRPLVLTLLLWALPLSSAVAQQQIGLPSILTTLRPSHPRLLATPSTWAELRARRQADPLLDRFLARQELEARALLPAAPVVYHKEGKRLLSVSRTVLRRVLLLSLAFHTTGDQAFALRARQEMLAVAAFEDWNPSHFLDVGEMTAALALGYDWLFDELDEPARSQLRLAIRDKGLKPGLQNPAFAKTHNNWNQVCLGGLTLGALAVGDEEPEVAASILELARQNNRNGQEVYAPDGVYPEGPNYWEYGTTFEVVMLDALRSALGTDWQLGDAPGFKASASSLMEQIGPTGTPFNFSDGGEKIGLLPALFTFARETKQSQPLEFERRALASYASSSRPPQPDSQDDRLLPLAALWWPRRDETFSAAPLPRFWLGRGEQPLAAFRDDWSDPNAMFLAIKGGSASLNHAHMDAGTFVFDALGQRWARDLGMQDYNSLESKGVDLWNGAQSSTRWTVFRLNNRSHNTLSIDNELHRVEGHAKITGFSDQEETAGAVVDLSPVFGGQAKRVSRSFTFRSGSHVVIRDELEGIHAGGDVRWAMVTGAQVALSPDGQSATLSQNGKQLRVSLHSSVQTRFEVISADPPQDDFNQSNPDSRILVAHLTAPASGQLSLSVALQPMRTPQAAP